MSKQKEYTNGELTIVWKADICIHAAECVKRMPHVYDPDGRPWISAEGADTAALKEQISSCPSGALTYFMNSDAEDKSSDAPLCKAVVMQNGPLIVHGAITVVDKDGNEVEKENKTAFCRCGASSNKPYCDGAHRGAGFEG